MNLKQLTSKLDEKFNIKNIPPDMPFSKLMPKSYEEAGIAIERYFNENFLKTFHGLMVKNSEEISKVCLSVFLGEEILDKIFGLNEKKLLIFSHHPMDMETSNRGFLSLSEKYLQEMQKRMISVYCLHTPLDINEDISTSLSIAKALEMINTKRFHENSVGFSGVIGDMIKETDFEDYIIRLKNLFALQEVHYIKNKIKVGKVAIIAGGGSNPKFIEEAIDLGGDTYLTGDYINKINNEYGLQQKKAFEEMEPGLTINLIECSHYATEKLVLEKEVKQLFIREGIDCQFIKQDNPWK